MTPEALAKSFNYSEGALAYRRDRYFAGSFADAADRDERDMYWAAWRIAVAHNRRPVMRLRRKLEAISASLIALFA